MAVPLSVSEDVKRAQRDGRARVALESTIITHGMPFPQNLETARAVEAIVREKGAVPATIAIIQGRIHIGLEDDDLETLAKSQDAFKASRADLGFAISKGLTASTTVAATMILAARAGIDVFATGGIGGVHRGASETFDISSDLREFTQSPVIVVSSGAKAILDIGATLETLETLGVPVVGYQCDRFPAFWSRESSFDAPLRLDTPNDIASLFMTRKMLTLDGGLLVANPVPEDAEIPSSEMETAIHSAIEKAERNGVSGKAVTPFLLTDIVATTEGRALTANIALIKSNAALAANIALALQDAETGLYD
ncbi:MAG: pseudouridine-5'-phosphate glycosidase [Pseudomonadota bacterium]